MKQTSSAGFYLVHTDPDSDASIYFSSRLTIILEPALAWLPLALAGLGTVWFSRRRRAG